MTIAPMIPLTSKVQIQVITATLIEFTLLAICLYGLFSVSLTFSDNLSITDNQHSPGGFDVIAHCQNCHSDYEWFCDKDGGTSDMKKYFFG